MTRSQAEKEKLKVELQAMREQVSRLEEALNVQQQLAFAAGIFQNDITVRTLLESLAEGVVVCDREGRILLINRRAEEIFGYSRTEVTGYLLQVLLPERFLESHRQYLQEFFKKPTVRPMGQGFEVAGKHKNGTEFPVEISLSYLTTEVGLLGLAFVTDITQRKQMERALKLRNEELDAFAHMVAHDIKASLSALIGYSEVLVDTYWTLSQDEVEEYLVSLARNGRRMNNIIDELLIFASLRKEQIVVSPLDMGQVVGEALERLQYLIKETGAEVVLPDVFHPALGHGQWVSEVWINYITNAIKYGGQPPRLQIGSTPQEQGYVKFWLKDNGQGLTEEQKQLLFESHVRLRQHPSIKGHGLGLAIVKRIVDKLDGHVSVDSEPGRGSTFSFTLPVASQA